MGGVFAEGRAAVGQKRHSGDDRGLRRQTAQGPNRLGGFEQAPEGLEQEEIDSRLEERAPLFLEDLADLGEVERAIRLDEGAERADRARDERKLAGRGFASQTDTFPVDLLERVGPLVRRQLDAVGVPRVGREDPRPGIQVVLVDLAHRVGVREVQRRARLARQGAAGGQQRPDRPVGEQDLFGDGLAEVFLHRGPTMIWDTGCRKRRQV